MLFFLTELIYHLQYFYNFWFSAFREVNKKTSDMKRVNALKLFPWSLEAHEPSPCPLPISATGHLPDWLESKSKSNHALGSQKLQQVLSPYILLLTRSHSLEHALPFKQTYWTLMRIKKQYPVLYKLVLKNENIAPNILTFKFCKIARLTIW